MQDNRPDISPTEVAYEIVMTIIIFFMFFIMPGAMLGGAVVALIGIVFMLSDAVAYILLPIGVIVGATLWCISMHPFRR